MRLIELIQSAGREIDDGLQRAWLLKQMSSSRDQLDGDRGSHHCGRTFVELADLRIPLTDDEEGRRHHPTERVTGARAEHRKWQLGRIVLLRKPIGCLGQPGGQSGDVKAQLARTQVDLLLGRRQEIQEQRRPAELLKHARYASIPRTATTAATAMGEKHDAACLSGNGKITIQDDARAWYTNRSLDHLALAAHITSLTLSREAGDEPVAVPGKMAPNTWPAKGDGR